MLRRLCMVIVLVLLLPGLASAQNTVEPNDPGYPEQWALHLLQATCAWGVTIGSAEITVAVVDSGVDLGHPDLVDRLRNDGADFVDNDSDPSDENGHGTNVAGIVAATLNNAEGIVGLAPGVRILPVRVMNQRGYGSDRSIARGIRFAADQGAQVINLSLGATLAVGADEESGPVSEAIRYAQSQGALVVAAAGNDFIDLPNAIVGQNPDVLVVAATDDNDRKAPFSNFGNQISVAAPGVHILSTMPTYPVFLTSDAVPRDQRFKPNYDYMSGTSQATPYVAALAALLFSAHPDWDATRVAQTIRSTAIDISDRSQRPEQQQLGDGRIDACSALNGQPSPSSPTAPTAPPSRNPTSPQGSPLGALGTILGCMVCLVALVLAGLFLLGRRSGRPTSVPPVYTPPVTPTRPPATAPIPPGAATQPGTTAWGTLVAVGGPGAGRSFPLAGPITVIGRAFDCTIVLESDPTISRRHAIVRNDGQLVTVEDAGSSHGTLLNDQPVSGATPVRRGDLLRLGQTLLRFE